jgi:excisionase family DNA binding protein
MAPTLLTVSEVADMFRVSSMTVYRLIRNGELPAVRVGRSYRVREDDLQAYLEAQVVDPTTMDLPDASQG